MTFSENNDFPTFIADMRVKWAWANTLGATISDSNFKTIIITALPQSWDPIVALLLRTMTSIETVAQLNTWWLRVSCHRSTNSVKALQINRPFQRDRNQLICTNPNCKRRGHTIDICYWPGGRKESQFPPRFGKRGGARGLAVNLR